MVKHLILPAILMLLPVWLQAQQTENSVRFANGNFVTGSNISRQTFKKEQLGGSDWANNYYVLVQFGAIPSATTLQSLSKYGISLHQYLPGNAYMAVIDKSFDFAAAKKLNIISINKVPAIYKISPAVFAFTPSVNKKNKTDFAVNYNTTVDAAAAIEALRQAGAVIVPEKFTTAGVVYIEADTSVIQAIAALPFVNSISLQQVKDKPLNYNSIAASGISGLNSITGKNLNGKNVTIGVGDNADISTHIDFTNRLINRSGWLPEQHGTHVAGTAAGAGIINVKNRGIAARATIINQFFSDIIVNTPAYITDHGMVLTNNSYYTGDDGCPGNGSYDELSRYADNQLKNYEQVLHVVASGNDGSQTCSPQPASFGTVKSGWQCAKDVLTVGAIDVQDYSIAYFSSRGPTKDGRLKPEITASGWAVVSTNTNNGYATMWGTSMSCPAVTGATALLYERYRSLHAGANPKAALIKAIACNTAEDLGNTGPDYTFGFGLLNARRAVEAIENNRYIISNIANSGSNNHIISVPAGAQQLKVMLYWADPAAASNAASSLINDLDLRVITPSAALRRPLVLNPDPAHVTDLATEATDHVNNIEQVVITNPEAGNHTININGFSIPSGTQEYIITYEIIMPSVQVEYPASGERLVPGETETLRWAGYGNETNSFTIEYSTNNGGAWTTIDNNVPGSRRSYAWVVPATVTNTALIRISRNSTLLSGQSGNFAILGQPIVNVSKICEGAIELNWAAISGATSYDVLQLDGDSMKVIGNTSSNIFTVTGLNKYTTYWFGVAAKNGTTAGRRSISVSVVPNSGGCTQALFNNDLKIDSILEPNTARQQFSNAGDAIKPVKVSIRNLGTVTTSGNYTVSYSYAGTTVTENITISIAAGASVTYTFSTPFTILPEGFQYDFKAWVTHPSDNNHTNDTAYKTVKWINNDAIVSLPFTETFEAMPAGIFTQNEMAIGSNKHLDFSASTARGRSRSFVNTGFALGGNRALTLDQAPYSEDSNTDSATLSYNLQLFAGKQLRFDFYYKNHSQADAPGNKVWIRGSENNAWVEAYNLYDNQAAIGKWKKGIININEVLESAVPAQTITKTFQIKLGQEGYNSANNPSPEIDLDDGYTFDNLSISEAENDVAVTQILSPDKGGCELSANTPVTIRVKNYSNNTLSNIAVYYQVNGGTIIAENIATLAANTGIDYTFIQKANFAAFTGYNLNVWVKFTGDTYSANDSIVNYTFNNSPVISSFPYFENFENSNGYFYTTGTNSTWQWGAPVASLSVKKITKAASGQNAWVTNLNGYYTNNETSYLVSPCFNISGLSNPMLSFSHIYDLEKDYDYSWVEYSTDGNNWQKLGSFGNGTNWYSDNNKNAWTDNNDKWHVASLPIPVTGSSVRFRFVMSSDGGVTKEGLGIDDIRIHSRSVIDEILPSPPAISRSGSWPNGWVAFTNGSTPGIECEINTHGQQLGTVTVQAYHNSGGIVRSSNNNYYLDKNFTITATQPPISPIAIRLYFTDANTNTLINAFGCSNCSKINDAYELGVVRYKGSNTDEDGTLANNTDGYYQWIQPANTSIVPHSNGYYAEISTNGTGEFWLSKGDITPTPTSACTTDTITFSATVGGATTYQWQVNTGSGYTNVSDGTYYTNSTTQTLKITNAPTIFSGYRYRCIINGTIQDITYTLRFKNIWAGSVDTNWFNAANWSCNTVPDAATDVIIPSGLSRYPVVNANTAIRNIRILPGASCTVLPGVGVAVSGQ